MIPKAIPAPNISRRWALRPCPLGETGGYLTARAINATGLTDLVGAWPLFTCQSWQALGAAVAEILAGPVTLVSDPFAPLSQAELSAIFPIGRPLHDHWIIDLTTSAQLSKHHRRKLRQTKVPQIKAGPATPDLAEGWAQLYAHLVENKHIQDARVFSGGARNGGGSLCLSSLQELRLPTPFSHSSKLAGLLE